MNIQKSAPDQLLLLTQLHPDLNDTPDELMWSALPHPYQLRGPDVVLFLDALREPRQIKDYMFHSRTSRRLLVSDCAGYLEILSNLHSELLSKAPETREEAELRAISGGLRVLSKALELLTTVEVNDMTGLLHYKYLVQIRWS